MAMRASARVLRALAVFGLSVPRAEGAFAAVEEAAARRAAARGLRCLRAALRAPGGARCIVFSGASGAGKSTALRMVARALRRRRVRCVCANPATLAMEKRSAVELLRGALADALSALARAGLSDATLLARPARLLSDGQRWRLALALSVRRANSGRGPSVGVVIADEFCAGLDLTTACGVARGMSGRAGALVIAATSREDLITSMTAMPGWTVIKVQ